MDEIKAAFIAAAMESVAAVARINMWVPLTYWIHKVNQKLPRDKKITPRKLFKTLEKLHVLDRDFTDKEIEEHAGILMIRSIEKRIDGKRITFVLVVTDWSTEEGYFAENETTASDFFQQRFLAYSRRESVRPVIASNTRQDESGPRCVAPTADETPEAPATPVMKLLQSLVKPTHTTKKDFLKCSEREAERLLLEFGAALLLKKHEEHHEMFDNGHGTENDLARRVGNCDKCLPLFNEHRMPFKLSAVNDLIHCLVELSREIPEVLWLRKHGGSKGSGKRLIPVTPSDSTKTFYQNGKAWLPKLHEALDLDGELGRHKVCFHLIHLHRYHEEQAFDDMCRSKGKAAKNFKMTPERQIAMFDRCNPTHEHGRMMRPFLNADNCNPFVSERVIRKLAVNPSVKPVYTKFMEKKDDRNAWHLPSDELVKEELPNVLRRFPKGADADLILSADHGQGAFRVNMSVVLIDSDRMKVLGEKHLLVGHINCKKDNRDALVDSGVAKGVNDSLKRVKESETLPTPIKLKGTGDLSCFSMALGKENMSGHHCWRCQMRHKNFQNEPLKKGTPWTLHLMRERLWLLNEGKLSRKDKDIEAGITHEMLFDQIEPEDWMCPVLHAVDLLANTVFKEVWKFVWHRVEDLPVELLMAREEHIDAEVEKDRCWEEKLEAEEHQTSMQLELEDLLPEPGESFDDAEHEAECNQQKLMVQHAEEAAKELKEAYEKACGNVRRLKGVVSKLEKNTKTHGKVNQELWMSIQRMLRRDFNVYISTYHGGDMEGNECRRLLRNAVEIMAAIKNRLVTHISSLSPEDEPKKRADEAEIELFCSGYARLFQYMDLISHYCYQPHGSMSNDDVKDAQESIRLATELWHRLMPTIPMKVHAWQHLSEDLEKYRGVKSHHEQQIERAHQEGKKHDRRLKCLKDFEKKTANILRHIATADSEAVRAMADDTEAKIKRRNRKRKRGADLHGELRTEYIQSALMLPPIETTFPSLLQLQKDSHKAADEAQAAAQEEA